MKTYYSPDGLPVMIWSEGKSNSRGCSINWDPATGEPVFLHTHIHDGAYLGAVMLGLIGGVATFFVYGLVVVAIATTIRIPADDRATFAFWIGVLLAIAVGYVISRKAGPWLIARGYGVKEKKETGPWRLLETFSLTDDQTYLGAESTRDQRSIAANPVILAHFGAHRPPIVISHHNWAGSVVVELQGKLTHEFVDSRRMHLERLDRNARDRRSDTGTERKKVV